MSKGRTGSVLPSKNKTTRQGEGRFTKKAASGGETFYNNRRAGSPPSSGRRRKKPYRGQGK